MSLKLKAAILVAIISFLFTSAFTLIFYNIQKNMVLKEIRGKLKTAAYAIDEILPPDYHDRARTKNAISEKEYMKYLYELTNYAKKINIYYLYTFVIINGKKYFTSVSATDEELKNKTYDKYFTEYPYNSEITKRAAKAVSPMVMEVSDSKYGHFLTMYIPQWTKKGNKYYLGADVNITDVRKKLNQNLITCVLVGLFLFTLSILSGIWVANQLSDPIMRLSKYAENIIDENLNYKAGIEDILKDILKRKDEIGRLAQSFNVMEKKLDTYILNLKETTAAKEKIESELKVAHNIQMGFLPKKLEKDKVKDIDLAAIMYPAKEVGGDLYDYFIFDDKLFFIIGDVSGKGVPAALFMSTTITFFRAFAPGCKTPSEIVGKMNNEIFQINESMTFVTLICGSYNLKTGEMLFTNAGHLPPYILKDNGEIIKVDLPNGIVVGVFKDFEYIDSQLKLLKNDTIVFYTDGITEAFNSKEELFGHNRLENLLKEANVNSSEALLKIITNKIFDYSKGIPQADDITVLTLKRC
jgi:sigma-B regulation protein RsbU (phosphoserine phosphatase)